MQLLSLPTRLTKYVESKIDTLEPNPARAYDLKLFYNHLQQREYAESELVENEGLLRDLLKCLPQETDTGVGGAAVSSRVLSIGGATFWDESELAHKERFFAHKVAIEKQFGIASRGQIVAAPLYDTGQVVGTIFAVSDSANQPTDRFKAALLDTALQAEELIDDYRRLTFLNSTISSLREDATRDLDEIVSENLSKPGTQYLRTDGNLTLRISDVGGTGLPYGSYPRLILIWMTTEAVRTGNRKLELGSSLSRFMAQLGLQATGGHWGTIPRFRDQMQRLVGAAISTRWSHEADGQSHLGGENLLVSDRFHLWWTPQKLPTETRAKSTVTLSVNFFDQLVAAPVPLDLRAIRALKKSPLALDLYAWATRRVSYLSRPTLITWKSLRRSFGTPQLTRC